MVENFCKLATVTIVNILATGLAVSACGASKKLAVKQEPACGNLCEEIRRWKSSSFRERWRSN